MWQLKNMKFNCESIFITATDYRMSSCTAGNSDTNQCSTNSILKNIVCGKYSVFSVANWFLHKQNMSHLKVQKLCYYAQAWNYALHNFKLIDTEFQAWVHGPVSPILYEKLHQYGYKVIRLSGEYVSDIDQEDVEILNDVWDTYGCKSANALEALTHREEPWIEARKGIAGNEPSNEVITPASMIKFYQSIYGR